jgi:hypothetical protein
VFSTRMGLNVRVEELRRVVSSNERREAIDSAAKRLVYLAGMGKEYLVLGIMGKMDHGYPGWKVHDHLWKLPDCEVKSSSGIH